MPSCAFYFFSLFKWFNLKDAYIASFIQRTMCDSDEYTPGMEAPTYNFEKMGFMSRHFMMNMSSTLMMVAILALLIPFMTFLRICLPGRKFIKRTDEFFRGRFALILAHLIFFKVSLLATLNFEFLDYQTS